MSSAAPRPTTASLPRRYRGPLLTALPAGAVLGLLADLAFSLQTVSASPRDLLPALLAYACIGAGFAAAACAGAVVAVLTDPRRTAAARPPFIRIAAGAALTVLIGALLIGGVSTAVTDSWGWFPAIAAVALVTGLLAGCAAAAITAFFEFRHRLLP